MATKEKKIALTFTPREIARGDWGKNFYVSTFRFPLKEAQGLERRAQSLGLTLSSLVNQLIMAFNKSVAEPEGVKLARTKHPTIWGADAKKKFFKAKGMPVPMKREAKKTKPVTVKKVAKVELKHKVAKKVTKPAPTAKASPKVNKVQALLAKLRANKNAA